MLDIESFSTENFSTAYRNIVAMCSAAARHENISFILEGTEKLIKEELVRCIWFGQHIEKEKLRTDDGLRLEILSPGWWNNEEGPDFKHAEFFLEGKGMIRGSVEIHVFASDWIYHKHETQKTYDAVCLHVVMWNDLKGRCVKNFSGKIIPQITLSLYLEAELDEIIETIDVGSYIGNKQVIPGYCNLEMRKQKITQQWIGGFLDYAGDERILQKAKKYEKWIENKPFERVLYEAIMESLGYKNNKKPFLMLASLVTAETIRSFVPEYTPAQEKKIIAQSLLLGMAGLLPLNEEETKGFDDETIQYFDRIFSTWQGIKTKIPQTPLTRESWSYTGIRPANFPDRRIVAIANILSEHFDNGLFRYMLRIFQKRDDTKKNTRGFKSFVNEILSPFLETHDAYWSYRYTPGGKKLNKPQKLLGKERTSNIFVNVIIPVMLVYARKHNDKALEERLHYVYRNYTPHPSTSVTKFMGTRIFGTSMVSNKVIHSARRQQGLYQLFKDFCENDTISCNKCALYAAMNKE
ncbi:MAG: hypothetical protein A2W17_06290 [Planctomycetes bacterium RBG_16_41_13]|nr:MAG: hypothetical protein A2W17_06290 [Planctomycetes bacterium RBG_16_41_13]